MLPSFLAMTLVITTDILKFPSLQIIPNICNASWSHLLLCQVVPIISKENRKEDISIYLEDTP